MRNIGLILCLIIGVLLLGWYGIVMLVVGIVLYAVGYAVYCWYEDNKPDRRRKEDDDEW